MYLDAQGIARLEDDDPISPLNATINALQDATSEALESNVRFYKVANTTERAALASSLGASTSNPLFVWRTDAAAGANIEYTTNGTTWVQFPSPRGEQTLSAVATSTSYTNSALIADVGVIAAADYPRVVECSGYVNISGVTANSAWQAVITSSGNNVTTNVIGANRFSFGSIAIGGGGFVYADFTLAAGTTCQPRLWVQRFTAGTLTTSNNTMLKVRVRPEL